MSKAAMYDKTGGPEVLYLEEIADASPGPGEVVIKVEAAGINPFDGKVRSGFIPSKAEFPRRIGSDLVGTVEAVGEGAVYWDGTPVGDAVMGRGPGSVAQRVVATADGLTRRPEDVPVSVAGALNVAGLTANSCLVTIPVGPGDTLLVGGATGAVGMIVSQLALARGARVIGTGAERNFELLKSLGVEPVLYGEGLTERVQALGPVTAVIGCHGREALDAGVELGVPADRMGAIAAYDALEELGVKNVEHDSRTAENLAGLADAIAAGELQIPIAQTFPLEEVVEAFTTLEGSHAPGKIVILP